MSFSEETLQSLTSVFSEAIKKAVVDATQAAISTATRNGTTSHQPSPKLPTFSIGEYKSSESESVGDYFRRFEWALQLSKIPATDYPQYARVHMGTELNNALKTLSSPQNPEVLSYEQIKTTLVNHFDTTKNKYAESIKFRHIVQQADESVANFTLRLRQGAVNCDYGNFLDRMLIEQFLHGLSCREMCNAIIIKQPDTFAIAYEAAQSIEASRNTAVEVKSEITPAGEATHKLGYAPPRFKRGQKEALQPFKQGQHPNQTCNGCGGRHFRNQCKFREAECHACGKKGHIARRCRSKTAQIVEVNEEQPSDSDEIVQCLKNINLVNSIKPTSTSDTLKIEVKIDGRDLVMELDTGSPCAIISAQILRTIKPQFSLIKSDRQFASYTRHRLNCIGRIPVNVTVGRKVRRLNLYVVEGHFDTLFGREWIAQFASEINFSKFFETSGHVNSLTSTTPNLSEEQRNQMNSLLNQYEEVFSNIAGKLKGPPASLHFKPDVSPVFMRAREIPLALRDAYAKEIDSKISSGFYKKVEYSEWASTTHIVSKKNGRIRITGNYKPTLNPRIIIDEHPIPKVEDIFNQMKDARVFCHLDVTDAYSHLPIDEEFSHAMTLNTTTHGLIRPTRAVYGAANIPAIWQRRIEMVFQGIRNVRIFFDDILIHAKNFDEMLEVVNLVLERVREHGLHLNREKCVFATSCVEFLGHKIDANGIQKSDKHTEAVKKAPKPSTFEELQLFLGKATYYSSFIPDLSTRDRPLRNMLRSESFKWTQEAHEAYMNIKSILISPQVLMPYDPSLPLLLATDASKTGLGAVLSHVLSNGQERPIAYASRTMSATEQRYPQIDKEALAIVWAVQKFFMYLYARHWTLITDHKPLSQILHPEKSLPVLCISRMANYAEFLTNFNYDVKFKTTKENANADYFSRASLETDVNKITQSQQVFDSETEYDPFDNFLVHQIHQLPLNAKRIAQETRKDLHLGKMCSILESGQCLVRSGFKSPESSYRLAANCLVFEHRVVIPSTLREKVLADLHLAHLGMVKMKGLARSFVFWPGIDADIERMARNCSNCTKNAHLPPQFREHHWEYPKGPWERVHIDYAGPVAGMMLLIVSDAYSKWLEVKTTNSMTTGATISILDELFAAYGVPVIVVSDNGTNFTSAEFKTYLQTVGVKYHKLTAPYHPSTNGQAERSVQTVKNALRTMETTKTSLQLNLNKFLRQYRKAPHTTTGQSPSQLFLGRSLRTSLDLLRPDDIFTKVTEKQNSQFSPTFRILQPGQSVFFLSNNPRMDKWVPGVIRNRLGDLHYEITYLGKRFKRHIDQIKGHKDNYSNNQDKTHGSQYAEHIDVPVNDRSSQYIRPPQTPTPHQQPLSETSTAVVVPKQQSLTPQETHSPGPGSQLITPPAAPRRSTRPRKPRVLFSP
ncbi:uncharacterized protein K02A2.6-like [Eupeodes corollae]|uniref:uncharacterized protein K02A2.6-like n=1 Tax=Eupeodes corollae TaxID=290404 RepID=UPI0024907605|nr:uncharacterized protein K02A2.6-like [Eupeodes corollae]